MIMDNTTSTRMHGHDAVAARLLSVAAPQRVTRKDGVFSFHLPIDASLFAVCRSVRGVLSAYNGAVLLSASFDRLDGRAAEVWVDIPSDPESVRIGSFVYDERITT
jgi:hypothetical protein